MYELSGIIILGILAQWLAWRIRVPAILPLILFGLLVGPLSTLWTEDHHKLLQPIFSPGTGSGLFPGEYLFYFVSLSIGIILFEGGLTLKRREIAGVGPVILKLITFGSIVTFIGGGLAAHFIMGLSWQISFLFGALVIVTGPTVIAPILQNIPLNRNVSTVLKWEGILIDPIGALVAVLVFEFIQSYEGGVTFTSHALISFFQIIFMGTALGAAAAGTLYLLIKNELVPNYLLNVFTLAFVLGTFVFSEVLVKESALLTVVVMGMVLGNLDVPRLRDILDFKESLSVLLISILFILLAANINIADLKMILSDWRSLGLFVTVVYVLRPAGVFLSTYNSEMNFREKLFISWVGPRGIVAAGIASLFGITLTRKGIAGAEFITPLVFMIVLGTVLLNATTARGVAKFLKVIQDASRGILFVGANGASRAIARYLQDHGRHVVLVDNNQRNVEKATKDGLEAFIANIYSDDLKEKMDLLDMGYLIAMTSSSDINEYAVKKYQSIFGENGAFRLITAEEMKRDRSELPQQSIFSYDDDFLNINEVVRDYPEVHEHTLSSTEDLVYFLNRARKDHTIVPIFIKEPSGELQILPSEPEKFAVLGEGYQLVYLGRELGLSEQENE